MRDRRGNVTGLFLREESGTVPVGARSATALLTFTRFTAPANDGYADNLSFTVGQPVPEPSALAALGLGALALARRRQRA